MSVYLLLHNKQNFNFNRHDLIRERLCIYGYYGAIKMFL